MTLSIHTLKRYILAPLALLAMTTATTAQTTEGSSSQAVVRRNPSDRLNNKAKAPGVTQRMEQFYGQQPVDDAERQWMRIIYRSIDLQKDKNAALYYPEEAIDGQDNLFRMTMNLLASNSIPAYEYLDGREMFTDQYRVKVRDVLDRFHIMYHDAKGSTEKNPRFEIDPADIPTNEVLSYYIIERWEFDSRQSRMKTHVEAICPVLHRSGDFGGDAVRYPMFWVRLSDIRPYMAQQHIFINDDNNLPTCTLDDYFALNLYEGDIYKTRNLRNKSMMQLYPDPDDLQRAQDSIQKRLDTFEDKLWVPSREEVIAAREAREALEAAKDSTSVVSAEKNEPKKERTRASRSSRKPTKAKAPKQSKVKQKKASSSSSATKSVRRRKR